MTNNTINISVPNLPESIIDATILSWHKNPEDIVKENDILVDIETDKIVLEIPSPCSGKLQSIIANKGQIVSSGQTIGILVKIKHDITKNINNSTNDLKNEKSKNIVENNFSSPAVRRLLAHHNLTHAPIDGTGSKGRITKEDVSNYVKYNNLKQHINTIQDKNQEQRDCSMINNKTRNTQRTKMSRLRKKISERLLKTKNDVVSLTTFNEVNMKLILHLKKTYSESFKKKHGVKLGLMSFCIKAVVEALKIFPEINAFIDQDDIVYYKYFDINIAISTPRGLVAPIIKNVDLMSMAQIEKKIRELILKSNNFQLTVDDLTSGNFTITNGGIFGSLFSTPLINPPQSAILGMHIIKERPVVQEGKITILPMMYLALTYDHRLIDGKESVGFLLTIKELLEDFNRIILNI